MSGYLETYGAGEEVRAKRERLIKRAIAVLALGLVLAGIGWYLLRNYKEDGRIAAFVELLQKKDYAAAYKMWGCSAEQPCRDYLYDRFLEDWGNKGAHADASAVSVEKIRACKDGVIRKLKYPAAESMLIFVSRADLLLSFPPWGEACEVRLKVPATN